jgi:hypothetical protein
VPQASNLARASQEVAMADHVHHLYPESLDRALWIAVLLILTVTVAGMFVAF